MIRNINPDFGMKAEFASTELEKTKKALVREYLGSLINEKMLNVMAQVFANHVDCKNCQLHKACIVHKPRKKKLEEEDVHSLCCLTLCRSVKATVEKDNPDLFANLRELQDKELDGVAWDTWIELFHKGRP